MVPAADCSQVAAPGTSVGQHLGHRKHIHVAASRLRACRQVQASEAEESAARASSPLTTAGRAQNWRPAQACRATAQQAPKCTNGRACGRGRVQRLTEQGGELTWSEIGSSIGQALCVVSARWDVCRCCGVLPCALHVRVWCVQRCSGLSRSEPLLRSRQQTQTCRAQDRTLQRATGPVQTLCRLYMPSGGRPPENGA